MINPTTSILTLDVRYYFDGDLENLRWASPEKVLSPFNESIAIGNRFLQYGSDKLTDIFKSLEMIDALSVECMNLRRGTYISVPGNLTDKRIAVFKYVAFKLQIRLQTIRLLGYIKEFNNLPKNKFEVNISCELLRNWLYIEDDAVVPDQSLPHIYLTGEELLFWAVANHQGCVNA